MRKLLIASLGAALCLGLAHGAAADPIGPEDCSTCQGTSIELLYGPVPDSSTSFEITLRIDTSGYEGDGARIGEVAFKVSPQLESVSLLDAPGGAGSWNEILGGINADGCQGNDNNGFACAASDDTNAATLPNDGVYEWVFQIGLSEADDLFTEMFQGSVKARFLDASGDKTGDLVSENITLQLIPEPGTLLLLGAGLAAIAGKRRA